jgi:hypothetical protein
MFEEVDAVTGHDLRFLSFMAAVFRGADLSPCPHLTTGQRRRRNELAENRILYGSKYVCRHFSRSIRANEVEVSRTLA